jgi:hypothetical protein
MAQHDFNIDVHSRDDISEIGLDYNDLAAIEDAENDPTKVVTKPPVKPYQLGYISVFCIIINKMIGKSSSPISSPRLFLPRNRHLRYTLSNTA